MYLQSHTRPHGMYRDNYLEEMNKLTKNARRVAVRTHSVTRRSTRAVQTLWHKTVGVQKMRANLDAEKLGELNTRCYQILCSSFHWAQLKNVCRLATLPVAKVMQHRRWINEYGAMVEWYWQGKTEVLGEKHYTVWVVDGWMSVEQWWNDTDREKLKCWEKNIIQCGW